MNRNKQEKKITTHMVITKNGPAIQLNCLNNHSSTTNYPATQEVRFSTVTVIACPDCSLNDQKNTATKGIRVQMNEVPNYQIRHSKIVLLLNIHIVTQ